MFLHNYSPSKCVSPHLKQLTHTHKDLLKKYIYKYTCFPHVFMLIL